MMSFKVIDDELIDFSKAAGGKKEEDQQPVVIVVVGAGGGGSNAVDAMIRCGIEGVRFLAVNTDVKVLVKSLAESKLQIGVNTTAGRGAGGMPDRGEKAAQEDETKIKEALKDADMVFVIAGMGGGTGTGSAPVIARVAKSLGALTVGVVTKPFGFELNKRMKQAEEGIDKLRNEVDTLIVIPNEKLFNIIDRKTPFKAAFAKADEVLYQGVKGISDIIVETGYINIDFADAEAVMRNQGDALMTTGYGQGEDKVGEAVSSAMDNPLLEDTSIKGATQILVYVSGGEDFSLVEYDEVIKAITKDIHPDANVIAGMYVDPDMEGKIRVTVIATGFESAASRKVQTFPNADKGTSKPAEVITDEEYQTMRDRTKKQNDFLPHRNGYAEEDLDIPTLIRDRRFISSAGGDASGRTGSFDKAGSS
ncbi:MAG: cell division protein FtsZ [Treponema sp.]|jgi:cell division protein FtsZ|nr:cell division protein FtsZ [Treponema sp.]